MYVCSCYQKMSLELALIRRIITSWLYELDRVLVNDLQLVVGQPGGAENGWQHSWTMVIHFLYWEMTWTHVTTVYRSTEEVVEDRMAESADDL